MKFCQLVEYKTHWSDFGVAMALMKITIGRKQWQYEIKLDPIEFVSNIWCNRLNAKCITYKI